MNTNKIIIAFFITLLIIPRVNAMTTEEESYYSVKSVKIDELPFESKEDDRQETINKLLLEFNSSLTEDYIYNLKAIKNYYNTGYEFGDEKSNYRSLINWIIYTRSLYALSKLGFEEEGNKLKEELDRAKRHLEVIDAYTDGKDYKSCLLGIWSIVASFDQEERAYLLDALREGKEIPQDFHLIRFFEDFS
jgi:hypothetical protein